MSHKLAPGISVEVCVELQVFFLTQSLEEKKEKKVYDFSSMEGWGNRSDIELKKKKKKVWT